MKNIKQIITLLFLSILISSCDTDGGTSVIALQKGGVTNINKNANFDAIINLNDLIAGEDITLGFDLDIQYGDIKAVDVVGFFKTGTEVFGPVTLQSNINSFPTEVILTIDDILENFPELLSREDVQLGDNLIVSTKIYFTDGSEISLLNDDGTRNYGADIHSSSLYNAQASYPVSCPSNLGGVYNVVSNGTNTDGAPPAVDYPYTVTVTDNGGGAYTISDGVAGLYILWYSGYGYTFETAGNFVDICGDLSGSWTTSFGGDTVELTGTLNEDNTLTIHWENAFGDAVDAVYTPQ